jgi:predicted helicase
MPSLDNARWVQAVFDNPYCFFGPEFMDYPRRELLDNVAGRDNIQLLVSRQIGTENWRHAFVADGPANDCLISDQSSEANQVFPLWRFGDQGVRHENFSAAFRIFLDARYEHPYTPEEVLGYIYAILRAPTYRKCYAEYLRIDFPRVPFPEASHDFETLSVLGWALARRLIDPVSWYRRSRADKPRHHRCAADRNWHARQGRPNS